MVWGIAAVSEPSGGVARCDGGEGGPGGVAEVVVGAGLGAAEELLDLGEGLLDRVEVGGVGGERQEASPASLNGRAHGRAVMRAEIVGHDDLARAQRWREEVLDIAHEARGRHRAVEPQARADAVEGQRSNDGLVLAAIGWRGCVRPLATRRPGMGRRVPQVAAGLIQEDQILRPDRSDLRPPGCTRGLVPLARPYRLFFRV